MCSVRLKVIGYKSSYESPRVSNGSDSGLEFTGKIRFRVNIRLIQVDFDITISRIYSVRLLVAFGRFLKSVHIL